jgi:hypothetical protein
MAEKESLSMAGFYIGSQSRVAQSVVKRLTSETLEEIARHKIGRGSLGGKSLALLLSRLIIQESDDTELIASVHIPESFFLGSDCMQSFLEENNLGKWENQKIDLIENGEAFQKTLSSSFESARLPDFVREGLIFILNAFTERPIIVRSSSLLEDTLGSPFAGLYKSFICPNQGSLVARLAALEAAVKSVYASMYDPNALIYRAHKGLLDSDERMAILVQQVDGEPYKEYYFPTASGVAISSNPYRWNPEIRPEEGMARMVWGLGTRAVKNYEHEYPRLVALSHPKLRPERDADTIHYYSQRMIDVVNLETGDFESLPVPDVLDENYPYLRYVASKHSHGEEIQPIFISRSGMKPDKMIITFDNLLTKSSFPQVLSKLLHTLKQHFDRPINIEFTLSIDAKPQEAPKVHISLLQCRPFGDTEANQSVIEVPEIPRADRVFTANQFVPQGIVSDIRYVIYVDPVIYNGLNERSKQLSTIWGIGKLNQRLLGEKFVLLGPGRWGSQDFSCGIGVTFQDIYNSSLIIELISSRNAIPPSYGTHFYHELVENKIFTLPLYPDQPTNLFDHSFFEHSPNSIAELLPELEKYAELIKVIDVPAVSGNRRLQVVMDGNHEKAIAYLA